MGQFATVACVAPLLCAALAMTIPTTRAQERSVYAFTQAEVTRAAVSTGPTGI